MTFKATLHLPDPKRQQPAQELPRPTTLEITAGNGTVRKGWAVADVKAAVDEYAPAAPGVLVNPMTTRGQVIYASADGTPAPAAALNPGAAGTVLTSGGPGADPLWAAVSGITNMNLAPNNQWGWFGPGSSATNVATLGTFAGYVPTATDSTSSSGGSSVGGGQRFVQGTSSVANNTTVLSFAATTDPTAGVAATSAGGTSKPIYVYTFGLGFTVTGYFAANFGNQTGVAVSATATQDNNAAGISWLAGDATFYAFTRAVGGGLSRTALNEAPASNEVYTMVVDYSNWPTSVRVALYRHSTAAWIGDVTFSSNLPSTASRARIAIYRQTETTAARDISHYSCGVVDTARPLSLP